jgi:hypothetical protein
MKFVLVMIFGLISSSVFAGNCHVQQVQAVVQHHVAPVVQFVEVPHYAVQQQVILQPVRQKVVVQKVQQVQQVQKVQQVVVKQQVQRVQRQRVNVNVRVR